MIERSQGLKINSSDGMNRKLNRFGHSLLMSNMSLKNCIPNFVIELTKNSFTIIILFNIMDTQNKPL